MLRLSFSINIFIDMSVKIIYSSWIVLNDLHNAKSNILFVLSHEYFFLPKVILSDSMSEFFVLNT